jgi:hypothetical protein
MPDGPGETMTVRLQGDVLMLDQKAGRRWSRSPTVTMS